MHGRQEDLSQAVPHAYCSATGGAAPPARLHTRAAGQPHLAVCAQLLQLLVVLLGGDQRVARGARGHGAVHVLFVRGRQHRAASTQQALQLPQPLVQVHIVLLQQAGLHVKVGRDQHVLQLVLCSRGGWRAARERAPAASERSTAAPAARPAGFAALQAALKKAEHGRRAGGRGGPAQRRR